MQCGLPRSTGVPAALAVVGLLLFLAGCTGSSSTPGRLTSTYQRTNLVSDKASFSDSAGPAAVTDPNLVNPWGITTGPTGPLWISDNGKGVATAYNGTGAIVGTPVGVPSPPVPPVPSAPSTPTGLFFHSTNSFFLPNGSPSTLVFVTEDGTISAWNAGAGDSAVLTVNNASKGPVYKGMTVGATSSGNQLYVTNFHDGVIVVYDTHFALVPDQANPIGRFVDPNAVPGFAPFNIQNIGGNLFVTYAKQDSAKHDDVAGPGNGYIDVFDLNGGFIRRFASGTAAGGTLTTLNAPWGMTIAPANFGDASNDLLVGNFGDGTISVFDPNTGAFLGQLSDANHNPITVPGLWGLIVGNGGLGGDTNALYFTAGINGTKDGLFGKITLR